MSTAIEGITDSPAPTWSDRVRKPLEAVLTGDGLKAKVLRGGAWLGTGSFSEQVIRFGRNMLLTRLLQPPMRVILYRWLEAYRARRAAKLPVF